MTLQAMFQSPHFLYKTELGTGIGVDRRLTPYEVATQISYLVTGTMLLHLADRQRLLASPDAGSRLRTALQLLSREIAMLEVVPSVPAIDLAQVPADPR